MEKKTKEAAERSARTGEDLSNKDTFAALKDLSTRSEATSPSANGASKVRQL